MRTFAVNGISLQLKTDTLLERWRPRGSLKRQSSFLSPSASGVPPRLTWKLLQLRRQIQPHFAPQRCSVLFHLSLRTQTRLRHMKWHPGKRPVVQRRDMETDRKYLEEQKNSHRFVVSVSSPDRDQLTEEMPDSVSQQTVSSGLYRGTLMKLNADVNTNRKKFCSCVSTFRISIQETLKY